MRESIIKTDIRIINLDGKFQPQIYRFVKVKFWERVRKEWIALDKDGIPLWFNKKEDAIKELDKIFNKKSDKFPFIWYSSPNSIFIPFLHSFLNFISSSLLK